MQIYIFYSHINKTIYDLNILTENVDKMTTRVRALYDFSGEPGTSELSITTDEVLTITRKDVGEGWWEGSNSRGQTGLFPEAYVEVVKETFSPVVSPTSLVSNSSPPTQQAPRYDQSADDWSQEHQEDWEDDWDEENETYSEIGPSARTTNNQPIAGSMYQNVQLPAPPAEDALSMTSTAPVKKSGIFAKSGDSYVLGELHF